MIGVITMAGTIGARLVVFGGSGDGFPLRLGDQVIGTEDAELSHASFGVENARREHAHVYWDGSTATLTDAGFRDGTLVNGDRVVGAQRLRSGDVVRVGGVELRYEE